MNYLDVLTPSIMRMIADAQGDLFGYAEEIGYEMNDFILQYMSSDFCNREIDSVYSFFHFKPPEVIFPYIKKEINCSTTTKEQFEDVVWVGKIYRYLVFTLGIPSKELVKLISPKELDSMSLRYELYNIEDAVKDIINNIHLT